MTTARAEPVSPTRALPRTVPSGPVRFRTLMLIRWIGVIGQAVALFVVHVGFGLELPMVLALGIVGVSALLNLVLQLSPPTGGRIDHRQATLFLTYDLLQLAALLFLTGGLYNPFAVLILLPRISSIDKRLEEAAYDLGASGWQMFLRVMLPLILPSILSAYLIAFVFSIDEVVIASFIAGDQPTYPVYLYSGLKFPEKTQTLIPVATIMIVVSFVLAFAAEFIRRRGDRALEGR